MGSNKLIELLHHRREISHLWLTWIRSTAVVGRCEVCLYYYYISLINTTPSSAPSPLIKAPGQSARFVAWTDRRVRRLNYNPIYLGLGSSSTPQTHPARVVLLWRGAPHRDITRRATASRGQGSRERWGERRIYIYCQYLQNHDELHWVTRNVSFEHFLKRTKCSVCDPSNISVSTSIIWICS